MAEAMSLALADRGDDEEEGMQEIRNTLTAPVSAFMMQFGFAYMISPAGREGLSNLLEAAFAIHGEDGETAAKRAERKRRRDNEDIV
jgi:hypothetical protein